jgi:hypothetical protein
LTQINAPVQRAGAVGLAVRLRINGAEAARFLPTMAPGVAALSTAAGAASRREFANRSIG